MACISKLFVIPVYTASQCNSVITTGVLYQQQFLYVANSSCLSCPSSCSSCLPTVDDVSYPCASCHGELGLVANPRSPLSAGGSCSNCSSIGLRTSRGSRRLRLTPLPSIQSATSTGVTLEGRLEVFFTGKWWSVCDDGWTLTNTNVVCRELSFGLGVAFFRQYDAWLLPSSIPAPSFVPEIGFDDVVCDPSDTSFFNCRFVPFAVQRPDCDNFETIGVRCSGPPVNNTCVANCPVGQTETVNGQCVDCPTWLIGCLSCKTDQFGSNVSCVACESPLWLIQNGSVCVVECPVGQYGNVSAGSCMPCRQPCRTCIYGVEDQSPSCTSCDGIGTVLFEGQCVRNCPPGLLLMNGSSHLATCVTQCPAGFYGSSDLVCRSCSTECLTCFGQSANCTACTFSDHVTLTEPVSSDVSVLITSCLSQCPSGYFAAVDGRCQRCCDSRCAACYPGGIFCSSCILQSDVIELGLCSSNCSQGLHVVVAGSGQQQFQCLPICDEGFYSDLSVSGDCKPCSAYCVQCMSSSVCMVCQNGYFVDTSTGQCVLWCPAHTVPFGQQSSITTSIGIRIVGGLLALDGFVEILFMGMCLSCCDVNYCSWTKLHTNPLIGAIIVYIQTPSLVNC